MQGLDTHVAGRGDAVTPSTHHGVQHHGAPPVCLAARGVVHHGLQALLQLVGDGAVGWGENRQ